MEQIDISELRKLDKLLTDAGIRHEWYDTPYLGGAEIKVPNLQVCRDGMGVSVIQFRGAWGAEAGKLECWVRTKKRKDKEPVGWLSAEEVLAAIKEAF